MTFLASEWYTPKQLTQEDRTLFLRKTKEAEHKEKELSVMQAETQKSCKQVIASLKHMLAEHPATKMSFDGLPNNAPMKQLLTQLNDSDNKWTPEDLKEAFVTCCNRYILKAMPYGTDVYSERGSRLQSHIKQINANGQQLQADLTPTYQQLDEMQATITMKERERDESLKAVRATAPSIVLCNDYDTRLKAALDNMGDYAKRKNILGISTLCSSLCSQLNLSVSDPKRIPVTSTGLEQNIKSYKTLPQGDVSSDNSPQALLLGELRVLIKRYEQDRRTTQSPDFDTQWLQKMANPLPSMSAPLKPKTFESKAALVETKSLPKPTRDSSSPPRSNSFNFQLKYLFALGGSCTLASVGLALALALGLTASGLPICVVGLGVVGMGMMAYAFFKKCKSSEELALDASLPIPG